ncbi:MAG: glycoside hydrolase family 13 protein [Actinobacteria bacterium]|nr:glycoside hydrolase family 13 protein [Actinomycetota bacterium]
MPHTPDWLADAVFYQIFPERFANADPSLDPPGVEPWGAEPTRDNFFGGDLAGITQHLDHIESLGANAIYLTPIFEADTNHRYDAKDYFAIDHRLGDLSTFRTFLDAAHARGIRVVLDAVLNHCGDGHWAFRDVVELEEASPYVNWFSVENFPVRPHPEPNYRTCSGCYYLPKWNAYNPEVRDHHYKVARYWVEQGIDGWRLDVPYFINDNFWRGFRDVVKGIDDDLYIVAEEWRAPEQWLQGDLADGTMNYTLRDLVLGFIADRTITGTQFAEGMNELTARVPEGSRPAMLNLLGSHDTERLVTRHGGDLAALRQSYALLLLAEGAPMIYYGDEVGLEGDNDPGCRGTMPWDEAEWNSELLASIRELIAVRRSHPAFTRGAQHVVALSDDVVRLDRTVGGTTVSLVVDRGTAEYTVILAEEAQ